MPIGSIDIVPHIARHFLLDRPASILDLGMGSGFYGAAVRQWVDMGVRPWSTYLAGVDAWADYRNPLWDMYDIVHVRPIDEFLASHPDTYECVLLNDVLEHYEHAAGQQMLERLKRLVSPGGRLYVSTPAFFFAQGAEYGNPYEQHRSVWTSEELQSLGFGPVLTGQEAQLSPVPAVLSEWSRTG